MYSPNTYSCFKIRGMYVCRTLSYKGAEFEVIEAPLEAEMMVCGIHFIFHLGIQKVMVNCIHLLLHKVDRNSAFLPSFFIFWINFLDCIYCRICIKKQQNFGQNCGWNCSLRVLFSLMRNLILVSCGDYIGQVTRYS